MGICNSCRYCEAYCAVFVAMERRTAFERADMTALANLCHNCGECLYACQYAPPHPFAINVPRTLAEIRRDTYDTFAWPAPVAALLRGRSAAVSLALTLVLALVVWTLQATASAATIASADFYALLPHDTLVALFGTTGALVCVALAVGVRRFWRHSHSGLTGPLTFTHWRQAVSDAASLRNLHASGLDCVHGGEERRAPWRRWFHHLTFYGFVLCFLSTTVAALYHVAFGWVAPYAYASVPVVLGALGGAGLVIGPAGLWWLRTRRDPMAGDPSQEGFDSAFVTLLLLTAGTGLALLALRTSAAMPPLLALRSR